MAKKKIQALMKELLDQGYTEDEIKAAGFSAEDYAVIDEMLGYKAVKIELELDVSHRWTQEEQEQIVLDAVNAIKGEATQKEIFLALAAVTRTALKIKTMGMVG